ncbi:MAG: hypothetical protein ACI3XR_00160 [Eubacteriales bacterium]
MKKTVSVILCLLLALSTVACNSDKGKDSQTTSADGSTGVTTTVSTTDEGTSEPIVTTDQKPQTGDQTTAASPEVTTDPVIAAPSEPDTTDEPGDSTLERPVGQGIFNGMTITQIWNKVMDNMSASTGMDVSVASHSSYNVLGALSLEDQTVHVLFNAAEDGYSYAVETDTDVSGSYLGEEFSESSHLYQAYLDGYYYTCEKIGETESSAKIAASENDLLQNGLDLETILALNAMINFNTYTFDGYELSAFFDEVSIVYNEDGSFVITCSGLNYDAVLAAVSEMDEERNEGSIGNLDDLQDVGAIASGLADLMQCDVVLSVNANGLIRSMKSTVSLSTSIGEIPFEVLTEYELTVNSIGAGVGVVTLPDGVQNYPVYDGYDAYLEDRYGDLFSDGSEN